jgi:hypothetical protein
MAMIARLPAPGVPPDIQRCTSALLVWGSRVAAVPVVQLGQAEVTETREETDVDYAEDAPPPLRKADATWVSERVAAWRRARGG